MRTTRTAQLQLVTDAARTAIVSAPSTHVVRRANVDGYGLFVHDILHGVSLPKFSALW